MPSKEYWQGRNLESDTEFKTLLCRVLQLDSVDTHGHTRTKADLMGQCGTRTVPISVKYASLANTQVHLPTLQSFSQQLNMPQSVREKLEKFFGTNDHVQWQSWSQGLDIDSCEIKYQRLKNSHIKEWSEVESWFNQANRDIAQLLLCGMDHTPLVRYLIWINKRTCQWEIIDLSLFVDWIAANCVWVTQPQGTVLRCVIKSDLNVRPRAIFFVQMKNSGVSVGYNHNPQFHLLRNWPREFIVCQGQL